MEHYKKVNLVWALSQENLSLGFRTKGNSNQYPQLHRLAFFEISLEVSFSRFSPDKAHFIS